MVWGSYNYAFDSGDKEVDLDDDVKLESFVSEKSEIKAVDETPDEDAPAFRTKRTIIMEPAMVLGFMIHISNYTLIGQYIYHAIGEKYNLTAVMDAEAGNMTKEGSGCGNLDEDMNSTAYVLQQHVQAKAARFNLYIDLLTDVPGFIVILFFGRLMDQLGRKPALLLPLFGLSLRALLYIFQQKFDLPLEILFLSGLCESTTGGFSTFMTATYAVIIDTINKKDRGRRLAIADISLMLGMAFMSFAMGVMIENLGFFWPFIVVFAGHVINMIYVLFFVPETGQISGKCSAISIKYVLDSFQVVLKKREGGNRRQLIIMVAAWLVLGFGNAVYALDSLYKLNSPFCWSAQKLGTYAAISALVPCFIQFLLAHFILKRVNNVTVILVSLVFMAIGAVMTGAAETDLLLWLAPLVASPSGLTSSLMRSSTSKLLPPDEQGSVFAFLISMQKITGVGASALYNNVYAVTLFVYKGTVYMMMAGFTMITFILVLIFKILDAKAKKAEEVVPEKEEEKQKREEKVDEK